MNEWIVRAANWIILTGYSFSYINVSQNRPSVAMQLRCGEILNNHIIILQIFYGMYCKNLSIFAEDKDKSMLACFLTHGVLSNVSYDLTRLAALFSLYNRCNGKLRRCWTSTSFRQQNNNNRNYNRNSYNNNYSNNHHHHHNNRASVWRTRG